MSEFVRCADCQRSIIKETKYMQWLKLYHFISFLRTEQYIEVPTRDEMLDALLAMRDFAFEGESEVEKLHQRIEILLEEIKTLQKRLELAS